MLRPLLGTSLLAASLLATVVVPVPATAEVDTAGWKLLRGDWDGSAEAITCEFDPATYAKYDNHGPIITRTFEQPVTDARLMATFTLDGEIPKAKNQRPRVVLTFDGTKGHAVRVWLFAAAGDATNGDGPKSRAGAWPEGSKKVANIIPNGKLPPLAMGEPMTIDIRTQGDRLTVTAAGETFTATHPGVGREKRNAKISFAFGDLTLTDLAAAPLRRSDQ